MSTVVECRELWKSFGGLAALAGVDLRVGEREILGVIGPNGAGKTTLFNLISGALAPTRGQVLFRGRPIGGLPAGRVCRMGIARTYQVVRPFESMTALDNVLVGLTYGRSRPPPRRRRRARALEVLETVGLAHRAGVPAASLTLVEKKHLEIARALATEPQVLLLDEVISGLNPTETRGTVATIRRIREGGVTVIMIEHVLRVVQELCDRVVVLNYGVKIAEGAPREVLGNPAVVEAYLGKFRVPEEDGADA